MQDKRQMAKLILAGLLVTTTLPVDVQAENFSGNEIYLAVAGCGGEPAPSQSVASDGEVADSTGHPSTPTDSKKHSKEDGTHKAHSKA